MAAVGMTDDVRAIPIVTRLLLQSFAVATVIFVLPGELNILPFLPAPVERALLLFSGLWFVNLVNFMDGVDWMTVAAMVPISIGLTLFGLIGALPGVATVVALALLGALIGFAPFNRPIAKLFLGDAGSLSIGLLVGWLLLLLARQGYLAAAILLPLYYCADATLTLLHRLRNRAPVWVVHRLHFYQRATARGFSVVEVVTRVFWVNLALVALATITVLQDNLAVDIPVLAVGIGIVVWLLATFARGKR
jgi:UDP-N-acetylmuramyl pentapeptide phosphotransferase/UDP-N-acetylglucosamine-1-phosphate transferase